MSLVEDHEPANDLPQQIAKTISGMRSELGCIREELTRAGHAHPAVCNVVSDVLQRCMSLASLITTLETIAAAKRQTGEHKQLPKQERTENLELFAASAARGRSVELDRIRASLHRAGDHTLDVESEVEA